MLNKKIALFGLAIAAMGLTACGGGGGGTSATSQASSEAAADLTNGASITYWCPSSDTDFFTKKVAEFKAKHPEFKGDITALGVLGEGEVKGELTKDPEACADVFEIADDNIPDSVDARAMTPFGKAGETAWATALYGESPMAAVTVKGNVYGLPYRNDNGYILAYDKTIVSDEQAKTLEGILAACEAANAKFNYKITDGWYTFSAVWAAGGKTYTDDQGVFHSEIATDAVAEIVGEFGRKLHASSAWVDDNSDAGFGKTGATKLGAVIMHNNYDVQKKALGNNLGVAVLPSFTAGNGTYAMKSFQGFKALGMRRAQAFTEAKKLTAVEFCKFMGSDAVAEARLTELGQGVSNKAVAAKTQLWTSPWLQALAAQGAAGNTVSQANGSSGKFWTPASGFGAAVVAGNVTDKASALTALRVCQTAQNAQD